MRRTFALTVPATQPDTVVSLQSFCRLPADVLLSHNGKMTLTVTGLERKREVEVVPRSRVSIHVIRSRVVIQNPPIEPWRYRLWEAGFYRTMETVYAQDLRGLVVHAPHLSLAYRLEGSARRLNPDQWFIHEEPSEGEVLAALQYIHCQPRALRQHYLNSTEVKCWYSDYLIEHQDYRGLVCPQCGKSQSLRWRNRNQYCHCEFSQSGCGWQGSSQLLAPGEQCPPLLPVCPSCRTNVYLDRLGMNGEVNFYRCLSCAIEYREVELLEALLHEN